MELSSKLSVSFFFIFFFLFAFIAHAQDSPQDYVNAHNAARSQVGVPNIAWDDTVATFAQNYANQRKADCHLIHSSGGGKYGENLAWSSGDLSGTDAVKMWVGEKQYYDYNSDSCASGKQCGHYTQVVWKTSIRVGCAKVRCNSGGTFIGCNYDPPGNYVGQRPFDTNEEERIFCPFFPSSERQIIIRESFDYMEYVNAHNAARSQVAVPYIAWNDTVAAYAQNYANERKADCQLIHSGGGGKYGENLAWSSGDLSGTDAVKMWVGEKQYYDYNSNSCARGIQCGHYTQVVWKNSIRVGCAKVRCDYGGTFINCNYDPPGNYVGQRPY